MRDRYQRQATNATTNLQFEIVKLAAQPGITS